jgi:hypothetical protein
MYLMVINVSEGTHCFQIFFTVMLPEKILTAANIVASWLFPERSWSLDYL